MSSGNPPKKQDDTVDNNSANASDDTNEESTKSQVLSVGPKDETEKGSISKAAIDATTTTTATTTLKPAPSATEGDVVVQQFTKADLKAPSRAVEVPTLAKSASPPSPQPPAKPAAAAAKPSSNLRRGKWTAEEEAYVARIIQDFNSGLLKAAAGTTLRSYLSEKLQCDPMRITKKFTGDDSIGKRVFHPVDKNAANAAFIEKSQAELDELERRWRRRLEMQQRENSKKSAAVASNVIVGSQVHTSQGVPGAGQEAASALSSSSNPILGQNVVTQAASWLDRANAILKGTEAVESALSDAEASSSHAELGGLLDSVSNVELENQMKEVQRLINEGPLVQQTTAGLPNLLASGQATIETGTPSPPEPADKRMRTGSSISGGDDAEALVGFVRSVEELASAKKKS